MGAYIQSKPFPNGSTFEYFNGAFCCRCRKYRLDDEGMPLPDNCEIENAIARAQFDVRHWPKDEIVRVGDMYHICLHFESDDTEMMKHYRELFNKK